MEHHEHEKTQKEKPRRMSPATRRQLKFSALILLFLALGTLGISLYGKGYRIGLDQGKPTLAKTGILNAESTPKGADVYISGHLTTATNNTVNLTPGKYEITISKDGYNPWKKDVRIQEQLVSNTDATLFPSAPSLQSISTFGIEDPILDPTGTKLAFRISGQSQLKNGIYVLDMTGRSFPVLAGQSSSTQVVNDTFDTFSKADFSWSPDGQQLLASVSSILATPTYYLLQTNGINDTPQDVTATLDSVKEAWKTQQVTKEQARMQGLSPKVQRMIGENFKIISWSPDDTKILYQATTSATLPLIIKPRRIGNNLLYEQRTLEKDGIYVYDTHEDVNTRILGASPQMCGLSDETCTEHPMTWFPDSDHLIYVNNKKIFIVDSDGANMTTIYAGPFVDHYVFPWPDGSKLVILTNLGNNAIPPTLYTIGLK